MSIAIYKPTRKMTGAAISFQASDRDLTKLFVGIIKQFNWTEEGRTGSFVENRGVEGKTVSIKFSQIEAGAMLDALERFYSFEAFHTSPRFTTQIHFSLAEGENPSCFTFRVLQTLNQDKNQKSSFFIPISFGEARLIREYLIHFLHKSFASVKKVNTQQNEEKPEPRQEQEAPKQEDNNPSLSDFTETSTEVNVNPDW